MVGEISYSFSVRKTGIALFVSRKFPILNRPRLPPTGSMCLSAARFTNEAAGTRR